MKPSKFQWGDYFTILSGVVKNPRSFFYENAAEVSWVKPTVILLVSSLIFTAASGIMGLPHSSVLMMLILFVNAFGMVIITSGLGYLVMALLRKSDAAYPKIFSIYAYASGAVLVVAWMPFMLWITEIWRWWLIGCGLIYGCGIKTRDAVFIISLSLLILVILFRTLLPVLKS